jgi:AcrR family transcriptional regulator
MVTGRRLKPLHRREHLLDTAAAMFAEMPYDDVLIQDIAARGCVQSVYVSLLSD